MSVSLVYLTRPYQEEVNKHESIVRGLTILTVTLLLAFNVALIVAGLSEGSVSDLLAEG